MNDDEPPSSVLIPSSNVVTAPEQRVAFRVFARCWSKLNPDISDPVPVLDESSDVTTTAEGGTEQSPMAEFLFFLKNIIAAIGGLQSLPLLGPILSCSGCTMLLCSMVPVPLDSLILTSRFLARSWASRVE